MYLVTSSSGTVGNSSWREEGKAEAAASKQRARKTVTMVTGMFLKQKMVILSNER